MALRLINSHPVTTIPHGLNRLDDEVYVIRLTGVFEVEACKDLQAALVEAEASSAGRILIDLEQLVSLDAAALHMILKASRRSHARGGRLEVTRGNGHVAELFRITALDQSLPFARAGA
jgi:anti-anti-sigma factor